MDSLSQPLHSHCISQCETQIQVNTNITNDQRHRRRVRPNKNIEKVLAKLLQKPSIQTRSLRVLKKDHDLPPRAGGAGTHFLPPHGSECLLGPHGPGLLRASIDGFNNMSGNLNHFASDLGRYWTTSHTLFTSENKRANKDE